MIYPYYSIRDAAANAFGIPQPDQNEATAVRGFSFTINNPSAGTMNFSPKDYDLYHVGDFDTEKGVFISLDIPVRVAAGTAVFQE